MSFEKSKIPVVNTWLGGHIANPSYLFVSVPTVRIDGGDPEMYVESGSSVVLRCHISDWLQKPQIVFWYVLKNSYK